MGLCEHDKMMYKIKKLDYGMLRWIVDYNMRRRKNHR